jgi:hypothetical protein
LRRAGRIAILLAATLFTGAAAAETITIRSGMIVGRWGMSVEGCNAGEILEFTTEGGYRSTLDEGDPHEGRFRTERDHIILMDADEPDRELALVVMDMAPNKLVVFDETIESDRMLVRCR